MAMGKKRTVKVGVTDFYVAKATYDEETEKVTYGDPNVFGGTATVGTSYTSRTVALASEMEVLHGLTATDGGDYIVGPDDIPDHWAAGWARKESDGTFTCVWFLWCEPSKGDESDETATETQASNPESYTFAASSSPELRADGKPQMKRVKKCANAMEMAAFFASVLPTA